MLGERSTKQGRSGTRKDEGEIIVLIELCCCCCVADKTNVRMGKKSLLGPRA